MMDLSGKVTKLDEHPFQFGDTSDLYRGTLDGTGSVVVKVLRGVSSIPRERELVMQRVTELLEMWSKVQDKYAHRNLCTFYGYVEGWGQLRSPVIPYFKNGNAIKYVKDHPEANHTALLIDIAAGLQWLHAHSIVHGNLKGSNVLVRDDGVACLSDIQLSSVTSTTQFTTAGIAGGARHIAPEIMNPSDDDEEEEDDTAKHTQESDIYSFAMTALEVLTGQPPFSSTKLDSVVISKVVKGIRPERPEVLQSNDVLWKLLQRCWDQDPRVRPSMTEVVNTLSPAHGGIMAYVAPLRERFRKSLALVVGHLRKGFLWIFPRRRRD
ncbi:kinase-like protein [Heliocybe sulcata]|uniref:Kinase-like protein n=1 Tax=Heliocybe sulcata TaxID=5364 RepID=A0A5C3MW75_9AGAM|nr:kinase-like protein [Heliocybe sulcata]